MGSLVKSKEKKFRKFIEKNLEEIKPDYIINLARKGSKLFDELKLIPERYRSRIIYPEAVDYNVIDIKNKTIVILDDSICHGTSIKNVKEKIQSESQVHSLALVRNKDKYIKGRIEDTQIKVCEDLNSKEFSNFLYSVSEFVYKETDTLDCDHLIFNYKVKNLQKTISLLINELMEYGDINILPSNKKEECYELSFFINEGIVSFPHFNSLFHGTGLQKIRVFINQKTDEIKIIPIIFPELKVSEKNKKRIFEALGPLDEVAQKITSNLSDKQIEYELLYYFLSISVAARLNNFIERIMYKNDVNLLNNRLQSQSSLERIFGKKFTPKIIDGIENISGESGLNIKINTRSTFNYTSSTLSNSSPQGIDKTAANVSNYLTSKQKNMENELEKIRDGAKFSEIIDNSSDSTLKNIHYVMDVMIDKGYIKPIIHSRSLQDNSILVSRKYRPGEPQDALEDIKNKRNLFIRYINTELDKKLNGHNKFISSFQVSKTITNIYHDLKRETDEELSISLDTDLYGYHPTVKSPKTDEETPLYDYYSGDRTVGIKFHSYFEGEKNVYTFKEVNENDLYDTLSPSTVDYLNGLISIYKEIIEENIIPSIGNGVSGLFFGLANVRDNNKLFETARNELDIWEEKMEAIFDSIRMGEPTQQDMAPLINKTYEPYIQLSEKIRKFRNLQERLLFDCEEEEQLKSGPVPDWLRSEFEKRSEFENLPEDARISKSDCSIWILVNEKRCYKIEEKPTDKLNIYMESKKALEDHFKGHPREALARGIINSIKVREKEEIKDLERLKNAIQNFTTIVRNILTKLGYDVENRENPPSTLEEFHENTLDHFKEFKENTDRDFVQRVSLESEEEKLSEYIKQEDWEESKNLLRSIFYDFSDHISRTVPTTNEFEKTIRKEIKDKTEGKQVEILSKAIGEDQEGYMVIADIINYKQLKSSELDLATNYLIETSEDLIQDKRYDVDESIMKQVGFDARGYLFSSPLDAVEFARKLWKRMKGIKEDNKPYPVTIGLSYVSQNKEFSETDENNYLKSVVLAWHCSNSYLERNKPEIFITNKVREKLIDLTQNIKKITNQVSIEELRGKPDEIKKELGEKGSLYRIPKEKMDEKLNRKRPSTTLADYD